MDLGEPLLRSIILAVSLVLLGIMVLGLFLANIDEYTRSYRQAILETARIILILLPFAAWLGIGFWLLGK